MSEPRILICGPGSDLAESEQSLGLLASISVPNATKFVVTTGKFDTRGVAKSFNVDADYPSDPPHMGTLSVWAGQAVTHDRRARDGFDLFSFRRLIERNKGFDVAILLRDSVSLNEQWPRVQAEISENLFLTFPESLGHADSAAPTNVALNVRDGRALAVLDWAWELYVTGAVYAMSPYSQDGAWKTASNALNIASEFNDLNSELIG